MIKPNLAEFAAKLRSLRADAGLSQDAVAKALSMTQPGYGRYERGDRAPRPHVLKAIAKLYGVDPMVLFNLISDQSQSAEGDADASIDGTPATLAAGSEPKGGEDGAGEPLVDEHWLRFLPDAGRPLLRKAAELVELRRRIAQIEDEIMREASGHWSASEIRDAKSACAQARVNTTAS